MTVDLNFREMGSGPALVIAHGLFGSSSNWQAIGRRLADRFRVLLVDMRNHGESPWNDTMDYPSMAADLDRFIQQHADGRARVLGHSMGAKAAMVLAVSHAESVHSLAAVDVAPISYTSGFRRYTQALSDIPLNQIQSRREAEGWLTEVVQEPGVRAFLLHNLKRVDDRWAWRINIPVLHDAIHTIAGFPELGDARYQGPALLIAGGNSNYVTDAGAAAARMLLPQLRLVAVPGAGHWVHSEQPDHVAQLLGDFFVG